MFLHYACGASMRRYRERHQAEGANKPAAQVLVWVAQRKHSNFLLRGGQEPVLPVAGGLADSLEWTGRTYLRGYGSRVAAKIPD